MTSDDQAGAGPARKTRSAGCLAYLSIVGVVAMGLGIYVLGRWNEMAGPAKAGAVMLIVVGTLALLPPLFMLGLRLLVKLMMRKLQRQLSSAAEQMLNMNKGMYSEVHEFRRARDDDFDGLNRAYYHGTVEALAPLGFRHLGDIVDETIEQTQGMAVPIRVLASADGTTQVGVYHFNLAGQERMICDVATEFSDQTFLLTSNTQGVDQMTPPPQIQRRQHAPGTPPLELIRMHEIEKQKLLAAKGAGGVTCMTISTLADAIESEKRQQQAKNAFRQDIGFIDPEEVRRIGRELEDGAGSADIIADATDEARRREQQ